LSTQVAGAATERVRPKWYPDYATTSRLDELRATEYSYLDYLDYLGSGGHTYLDYAGAGLAADAQLRAQVQRLRGGCLGNPHSDRDGLAPRLRC
jgi:hypothetical protein